MLAADLDAASVDIQVEGARELALISVAHLLLQILPRNPKENLMVHNEQLGFSFRRKLRQLN
jgi:hypothetical protein